MRLRTGIRPWQWILGGVVIAVAAAFALAQQQAPRQPVRLVYWTPESASYVNASKAMVAAFNATHPGIEVVHRHFPFEARYAEMLQRAFAGRPEADVVLMYGGVRPFAAPGKILPLPPERFADADLASRFLPAALENRRYLGRCYGLPLELNVESPSLFINRGLLRELGEELPPAWLERRMPDSWTAVQALAARIARRQDGNLVRAGLGVVNRQEEAMFLSLIWQLGDDFRDPAAARFRFATPTARRALDFMAALVQGPTAVHSYGMPEPMQRFQSGELAMTIGAPWYASEIKPGIDWVCLNLPPLIPGAKPAFVAEGGWGLAVTSTCADPDAAWAFVDYLTRQEQVVAWANAVDSIPPLADLDSPVLRGQLRSRSALTVLDVLSAGRDPGFRDADAYALVWEVVRRNLRAALQGDTPPDLALATMQREADALLGR